MIIVWAQFGQSNGQTYSHKITLLKYSLMYIRIGKQSKPNITHRFTAAVVVAQIRTHLSRNHAERFCELTYYNF